MDLLKQAEKNAEINLNKKVAKLGLSVRSANCLRKAGIVYVSDLVQMTENDLLSLRNFGLISLREIKSILKEMGFALGMSPSTTEQKSLYQTSMGAKLTMPHPGKVSEDSYQAVVGIELMRPHPGEEVKESYQKELENLNQDFFVKALLKTEDLDLSARATNCLKNKKIIYVGDLIKIPTTELLKIHNFGRKSFAEIKKQISMLNLNFGMEVPNWPPEDISLARKFYANEIEKERNRLMAKLEKENIKDKKVLYKMFEETNNLEEELSNLANIIGSARNKEIIIKYFGWDGSGPKTLQVLGEEFGLTRERIRQILNKFENKLRRVGRRKNISLPNMDAVLQFVAGCIPNDAKLIESELVANKLTKKNFKLESLIKTAKFLDRKISFRIEKINGIRYITLPEYTKLTKLIIGEAKKSVEHWGVSTLADITSQVEEKYGQSIDQNYTISILTNLKEFQWIDEASGWFWLTSVSRNRLINQITKILSVTDSIEISELRSGISRHRRMEGFAPPRRVLLEICHQLPWCRVERNVVTADPPLDWEKILAETEWSICWILKEHGPVMIREKLEEMCLELGMNQHTFYQYLAYSPIIIKYVPGIYGLRGAKIAPSTIESLKGKEKPKKVLVDFGWTKDGKIWSAHRLSKGIINTGIFNIPATMQKFLQGEFNFKTADNASIGTLKVKSSSGWNLKPLFQRRGGEPEDYLVLVFDMNLREVKAYMGNLDLLDDFQVND